MLKSELEKLKQEKESNQLKIENFNNASKSLDKLIWSQITNNSRKGVGFISYNVVPPPPTGLFLPLKLDMSNSSLEEFQQPKFEGYLPKTSKSVSKDISNEVKESPDAPLVKKLLSNDKLEKKTVFPIFTKIKFVRPKQQENQLGNQSRTCPISLTSRNFMANVLPLGEEANEEKLLVKELLKLIYNKKNIVRFIDTGCFILSLNFKLADKSQVLLKVPRKSNMYSVMKNIVPKESLTCLVAKDTLDESMLWHRRLCHIKFKNINKLVKENLMRGLPTKHFENDQTCVACLKGKQHKASSTKDETSYIIKSFITEIENLVDKKRRNRTLIEAARTILADSKLPTTFWTEVVNTTCYVQNKVLVVKPHNKTFYELFRGRTSALSFMRPFGCHVTILNTLDHLGKSDGKSDDGFFVGYSLNSKAFRVYNIRTRKVEENLHITLLKNKPIIAGDGPKWLFDIDALTKSMNYVSVVAGTNFNYFLGTKEMICVGYASKVTRSINDYILMPLWKDGLLFDSSSNNASNDEPQPSSDAGNKDDEGVSKKSRIGDQERPSINIVSLNVNIDRPSINTSSPNVNTDGPSINTGSTNDNVKVDLSNISTTRILMAIGTKWTYKNKKDKRGILFRNKARRVTQGYTQEEEIDYDQVFAPVNRIEAIRLFLAYASFKDFVVYQMDVKSALYGKIEEEETATARTVDNGEIEITAIIDGKVKIVTKAYVRRYLKLADSDGISSFPTTDIFKHLSLMRISKGYTRVDILLFPTILVQGPIVQSKGSTVPVESHHTPIGAPSTSQPHSLPTLRIPIRQVTEVPRPSSPPHTNVADEAASTGVDVKHRGAATTVTSLDTGHGGGNIDKTPSMPYDSPLPRVNTLGSDEGSMILQEFMLIKKVKKLEKKVKSSQVRRRARIVVSDDEDDLEDSSKQGRKIATIDQDSAISLIQHDAQTQGRYKQDMEYDTSVFEFTTASVEISTASPKVKTDGVYVDDTFAETLVYIRRSEEKEKIKQAEIDEEKRQRITMVHETTSSFNIKEREDIQAKVEADEDLAVRLQAKQKENYTKAKKARMLAEFINQRKRRVPELVTDISQATVREAKLMIIVPEEGMNIEALQTKYSIIDREVELNRLFKPDANDELWKSQKHIHHDDITWILYDTCGVHHVSTKDGVDIYMLVEREYPLLRGVLTLMLVVKLMVDQYSEMENELLQKIFMQAERPRR
nr:putative ribonuclease H-like domain-containing protein [Tanacetum cinerariifolium]